MVELGWVVLCMIMCWLVFDFGGVCVGLIVCEDIWVFGVLESLVSSICLCVSFGVSLLLCFIELCCGWCNFCVML